MVFGCLQCLLEQDTDLVYVNANYRLKTKFDAGSHGEVWKATGGRSDRFVLKRLFLELGEHMVLMGLREAHFGRLLAAEPHVARFVEHFFRPTDAAAAPHELWLAFHDEGTSLRHYLYARRTATHAGVILEPSPFWRQLRTDAQGEVVFREILRQLLEGVAAVHARGITHRDIKPSNILVSLAGDDPPVVKLADFGSAVDDFTLHHLYPNGQGPSQAEETREYQPPEVLFSDGGRPYDSASPLAYDLWSVGVVFLEMLLGSPQVFTISPRARAKLDATLSAATADEPTKRKSYLLHVLSHEFCIFQPPPHQLRALWRTYAVTADGCSFGRFNLTVVARDPLHKGLEDPFGLDLLWKLLQWHPSQRISAAHALEHAFFKGAYVCPTSGRRFATRQELAVHEAYLAAQAARDSAMAYVVRERYELPIGGFACPHCRRTFATVASCEQHLRARKHDAAAATSFCAFDSHLLEHAVATETAAYLADHPPLAVAANDMHTVGAALFQGRKKYMEDVLLVASDPHLDFELFAVSDGHLGTRAAAFVVANLLSVLSANLAAALAASGAGAAEREFAERVALRQTFLELHSGFLELVASESESDTSDASDVFSGCTLTVVLYFRAERRLVSANVGDSRAIALVREAIVPLSTDHWPNVDEERVRIESSGGFVSFAGLWRVVGQLAVSRSIGDQHLRQYVSAEPSIVHTAVPLDDDDRGLLVVASDGVWETMTNRDVARFASERRLSAATDLRALAQRLLVESYVRGSQDNLAAILVAL